MSRGSGALSYACHGTYTHTIADACALTTEANTRTDSIAYTYIYTTIAAATSADAGIAGCYTRTDCTPHTDVCTA